MKKRENNPRIGREEPFPCLAWYGLALLSDLPEADREPFRLWLLKRNKNLPEAERWPFVHLKVPTDLRPPILVEDIFAISDHTRWELAVAFARLDRVEANQGAGS
jgi:hypothetical protein